MKLKDLQPLFPSGCYQPQRVLLVPPSEFHRLEGMTLDESRLFMLVCAGTLQVHISGKSCVLKESSFFDVMETATVQIGEVAAGVRAWCLLVTFEFASEALKNLRPGPRICPWGQPDSLPVLNLSEEESAIMEQQLRSLQRVLGDTKHAYRKELAELYFKSFSLELGNFLFRYRKEEQEKMPVFVSKRDSITDRFLKLVSQHSVREHHLRFYADALYISTKHLDRVIKEMTGKTPAAFICDDLIHHAKALLEDDQILVSLIAEELHFADQASFCKFFKKRVGLSPMEYRRKGVSDFH